ncbi:MAG TPA: HEAT repeat domain-containing protein [Anaerolineales bacterium]|nr:HEAT repeat domain-containing protein [Anaerolineales bacterium]
MPLSLDDLLAELTSGDEQRAEAAAVEFHTYGKKAFYMLAALIASQEPDYRWWALRALNEFDDKKVANLMLLGLDDEDPDVRTCAALGLRTHPHKRAIPKLLSKLGNPDQLFSRLCRDALTALGTTATPHLIKLLEDPDAPHTAQLEAVRALAEIEDPASISALFKVYQEGSSLMQYWAEEGLNNMGIGMVFFDPE